MSPCEDRTAFEFKGSAVSVGEVIRAALFRGGLQPHLGQLGWKLACEEQAEASGLEAEEGVIDTMVERFRYDRDLESAEETEAWLETRGLDVEDLQAYFTRSHWWNTLKDEVAQDPSPPEPADPDQLGLIAQELLFSGQLTALAAGLGRRLIAAAAAATPEVTRDEEADLARIAGLMGIEAGDLDAWLAGAERGRDWLGELARREALHDEACAAVLAPARLASALVSSRQPLTRLSIERAEFDTMDAAREALLCIREDNLSLEEVARDAGFPFERLTVFAGDLPDDQRERLLCARIGEVQPPAGSGGVLHVSRVLARTDPTLDDPLVRGRVERRVLDAHFSEAGAMLIHWVIL